MNLSATSGKRADCRHGFCAKRVNTACAKFMYARPRQQADPASGQFLHDGPFVRVRYLVRQHGAFRRALIVEFRWGHRRRPFCPTQPCSSPVPSLRTPKAAGVRRSELVQSATGIASQTGGGSAPEGRPIAPEGRPIRGAYVYAYTYAYETAGPGHRGQKPNPRALAGGVRKSAQLEIKV